MLKRAVLLAVAIAATVSSVRAAQSVARQDVDATFSEWSRRDSPGCALGVYAGGRIVYERGYGSASLEHDVAITPETVFYVGSLSKQFTAMAAALAIRQGPLSPDDPIRKYLPELPDYTAPITVRHLVHHTSGLRDYNTLLSIAGRRGDEAFDNPTVLRITARQTQLNFEPGTEYLYSNTGYTLLATVVERATGVPFAAFADQHIFRPLGMEVTHFHTDETRLVKNRAFAYARASDGFALDTPSNERAGAGGVFSSVRDLIKWDENFYTGRVGGPDLIERLQVPGKLKDGTALTYAWGLQIGRYRGTRLAEHSGSLGGYRAHLMRLPDLHFSVAVLCNLGTIAPGALARRVANAYLGDRLTGPVEAARPPAAPGGGRASSPDRPAEDPGGDLSQFVGRYHSSEVDATFTVSASGRSLLLKREADREPAALQPIERDRYRFRSMTVKFERDPTGRVMALSVDAGRVRNIRFERMGP
jgi:CubicO group peptidase (beta-lactamase class C family)